MARKKATIKTEPPKQGRYATFKASGQGSYPTTNTITSKAKASKKGSSGSGG